MSCQPAGSECLRLGGRAPITREIDTARRWRAGAIHAQGTRIRPTRTSGFEFEALNGGQSGTREPKFAGPVDNELADGSITWAARAVSNASLRKTIATVEWEADPSITVSGETVVTTAGEQSFTAYFEPAQAGTFELIAWVTFSGSPAQKEGYLIELTVV